MAKGHLKRCSKSLIIKEMQGKSTIRYHPTSIGRASTRRREREREKKGGRERGRKEEKKEGRKEITSVGNNVEKLKLLCTVGGIVK